MPGRIFVGPQKGSLRSLLKGGRQPRTGAKVRGRKLRSLSGNAMLRLLGGNKES